MRTYFGLMSLFETGIRLKAARERWLECHQSVGAGSIFLNEDFWNIRCSCDAGQAPELGAGSTLEECDHQRLRELREQEQVHHNGNKMTCSCLDCELRAAGAAFETAKRKLDPQLGRYAQSLIFGDGEGYQEKQLPHRCKYCSSPEGDRVQQLVCQSISRQMASSEGERQ